MRLLYCFIFSFLFVFASLAQTDTSYVIPDPKAPMVPPYSAEYFNNNAKIIAPVETPEVEDMKNAIPVFKPKVSLGTGMLSFFGDLYGKHYQAPWTSRVGYDLNLSH